VDGGPGRAVLHIEALDPAGKLVPHYSGNALAPGGAALWTLPLAFNDPAGQWTIRVTDPLTGGSATARLAVQDTPPHSATR
jgi:hypothetical protein